ncbi:MAG: hypothetical protein J6V90_10565 [Treponema sp.]|nr:hypothetical protein [Treponema sp.]
MKFIFAKKTFYAALALSLALALFSCENNVSSVDSTGTGSSIGIGGYFFPDATHVVGTKNSYVYGWNGKASGQAVGMVKTVYLNGWEDVPFLSLQDAGLILSMFNDRGCSVGYDSSRGAYTYKYSSGSAAASWPSEWNNDVMYFDPKNQTVWSDEFVRMISPMDQVNNGFGGDSVEANQTADEYAPRIVFSSATDQIKAKERTTIDLGRYGLKMFVIDEKLYIPFQALSPVFLEIVNIVFNGTDYYINLDPDNDADTQHKAFESGRSPSPIRSRLKAEYNYRAVCLCFDTNYCLKDKRAIIGKDNINLFNDSIFAAGLGFDLLSTDTETYDKAFVRFLMGYIDDGHTFYQAPSIYQSMGSVNSYKRYVGAILGPRYKKLDQTSAEMKKRRAAAGGLGSDPNDDSYGGNADWWYIDNGTDKLGILVFDTFETPQGFSPYKFFTDAFNGLKAEHPGIKNIVIDISCNGGGLIAQCLAALNFLDDSVYLPQKNHLDNSITRHRYVITDAAGNSLKQVSADGSPFHFYVLTSGFSFSCGNLFPAVCKHQLDIPIVGQQSGGGGGVVKSTQTTDGAVFRTSASREMCAIDKSGNYVSIDSGVPVDLPIPYEAFYGDSTGSGTVYWDLYQRLKAAYPGNF